MDQIAKIHTATKLRADLKTGGLKGLPLPGGTIAGNLTVQGTTNLNRLDVSGPLTLKGTANEILFQDGGQIRSLDNNHRILFRRPENKLEIREFGDIVFSPGATSGTETAKAVILANGNVGIGTAHPQAPLSVAGDVSISGSLSITGTSNEIYFRDSGQIRSTDNNHRILFRRPENKLEIREFGDIIFSPGATSGAETAKAVMLANGHVGIGTTSPTTHLEVNGTVKAGTFQGKFMGDGTDLYGVPGVAWSSIVKEDIDVRSSAVNVCQITIAPPRGRVYIVLRFDGTCKGSSGDRIFLAASNVSKQWTSKNGSVSTQFNSARGLEQNFCHTMVCYLPIDHQETGSLFSYYAVVQNSGDTGGTGKATIYGTFTVEVFKIDYADW